MSVCKPTVRWWQHQWKGIAHGRPATLAKKDSVHSQGTKSTVTPRQKNRNLAGAIAAALASPSDRCTNSCRLAQACTNSTGPSAGCKTCATARPRDATSIHLSSAQQTLWASTSCIARSRPRCYDVGGFDSIWPCSWSKSPMSAPGRVSRNSSKFLATKSPTSGIFIANICPGFSSLIFEIESFWGRRQQPA